MAWLILLCIAWIEIKEMGHDEPFIRTSPDATWRELQKIERHLIQEHLHPEYNTPIIYDNEQRYIPIPPIQASPFRPKVSIIMACHNEGVFAGRSLDNLLALIKDYNAEIIAIDNLSVDNTFAELSSVIDSRIQLAKFEERLDYSAALRSGILRTTGQYVLILEPVLAANLFSLSPIISPLITNESAAVLISRRLGNWRSLRTWMRRLLALLIRFVCNIETEDSFPLGAAYSGELVRRIVEQTLKGDFRLSTLYYLGKQKMPLSKIPLDRCSRPFSGVRPAAIVI